MYAVDFFKTETFHSRFPYHRWNVMLSFLTCLMHPTEKVKTERDTKYGTVIGITNQVKKLERTETACIVCK